MRESAVSVVITSYNKPDYLRRAIQSVLDQTFEDFTLIIADDNSPNKGVWDVINSFSDNRLISFDSGVTEEKRYDTARYATQINTAIREYSQSNYICCLADDDIYYPEMLLKMVRFADRTRHDVVFCAQHLLNEHGSVDGVRWYPEPLANGFNVLDHNQVMTTRRLYDEIGGWDDSPSYWSGADAYFFDKISRHGYMFYPIDYDQPLQGKVYRRHSVQWNVFNGYAPSYMGNESMD